jgi:hypothetical protein
MTQGQTEKKDEASFTVPIKHSLLTASGPKNMPAGATQKKKTHQGQ